MEITKELLQGYRSKKDEIRELEYMLKPGYHYLHDCRTNTTTLVDHLKNMQKGEKKNDVN